MDILLEVKDLKKYFPIKKGVFLKTTGYIKAVDSLSFNIKKGETLGLVGESGCGKTTTGRLILRLMDKTDGQVYFEGKNIFELGSKNLQSLRKNMQIIFQDPYSSLNPRITIGSMLKEILKIHKLVANKSELNDQVSEILKTVGLSPEYTKRYPHEFSGGQRQRIAIARALVVNPKFIICDEPVSALDVSTQAQIINLLKNLQKKLNLTYLFIAHDLSIVKHISHRIAVMYLGKIIEMADYKALCHHPLHPHTKLLLSCLPMADPTIKPKKKLKNSILDQSNYSFGCHFHPRCNLKNDKCLKFSPELVETAPQHLVSCHLYL
ncbi:ATP-binding cassette domain-containing protein [bacterium]|nr:ATP-binding cassette domain-containing protein [bacterium]